LRTLERDFLLILLAVASGSADAWSYIGLGHAFVANMTGNTVLIGLALFAGHDLPARLISLVCYLPGVALAAWLTRRVPSGALWPDSVSWTLLLEGSMLAGAEAGWSALHHEPHLPHSTIPLLLGIVAFAIGMQSGAMLQLEIPGIVTTYITGTWTNLVSGLTTFRSRERGKPLGERVRFEERLVMQGAVVAAYLASAVLAGWLGQFAPGAMGLVPSSAVLAAAVYGLARPRQINRFSPRRSN
jgi:uncharacterized membrane protein YoaK (UPF0700 family)